MAKGTPISKLVNGEIADADVVNQIVEDAGNQGGAIPYDPSTNEQSTTGNQNIGSVANSWGSLYINQNGSFIEVDPVSPSAAASVLIKNLRRFITLKDSPGKGTGSYTGQGGKFLQVDSGEDGLQFATPSNIVTFLSSGTWVCPAGISIVYLTIVGGGGGGGGGATQTGGGGGGGAAVVNVPFLVTPGNSYTVTVGAGGTSGNDTGTGGNNGGNSSFSTISCNGGTGGSGGGGSVGAGGAGGTTGTLGIAGQNGVNGGNGGGTFFGNQGSGSAFYGVGANGTQGGSGAAGPTASKGVVMIAS